MPRGEISTEEKGTAMTEQEKAERKLADSLGYLGTLTRARAEATERVGPWRDREPSAAWWIELVAAERRNADEIAAEYIAALPLAVRAPEIAQLAAMLPDGEWGADELGTLANWLNGLGFTTVSED